jgi:hypothetical protein
LRALASRSKITTAHRGSSSNGISFIDTFETTLPRSSSVPWSSAWRIRVGTGPSKDQATSKGRRSLLGRAVRIDEEGAHYSASWGLGQIMGFHAKDIGFGSAVEMVRYMEKGGLVAQIEVMVRMIKKHNLVRFINSRRWASFAKAYNGSGYRANKYDTKLAAAFQRWETEIA